MEQRIQDLEQEVDDLRERLEVATSQVGRDAERITSLELQIQELRNLIRELSQ